MRIITNEPLVKRNATIGRYAFIGGTVLLIGALIINLLAFTRPNDSSLLLYVIVAFFVGFTLTNIGNLFNNRWGRRPDRLIADSLKGLDDRYALYNFRLGASHVLTGPHGVLVLVAKHQSGPILYDGKRWHNPGARRGFLGLFNSDPLGNPILEAAGEVDSFNRFLQKQKSGVSVAAQGAVVFLNTHAEISAKDAPLPVLHYKQLKDFVRKLPKDTTFSTDSLAALSP